MSGRRRIRVLKIGGSQLGEAGFMAGLANHLRGLEAAPILVHGGGRAIDRLQGRLGMEPVKIDGLRRSQPRELEAALMALCGSVNKQLVAALVAEGIAAIGLAGVDGGLLRVEKLDHPEADLGFVGEIVEVNPSLLLNLVDQGALPVIAPLSLGPGGEIYNVNADQVAAAIGRAVGAVAVDFVSNVPGVLQKGIPIARLSTAEAQALVEGKRVNGGMIPKIRAALEVVGSGVPEARIVDLQGLKAGTGTVFHREADEGS